MVQQDAQRITQPQDRRPLLRVFCAVALLRGPVDSTSPSVDSVWADPSPCCHGLIGCCRCPCQTKIRVPAECVFCSCNSPTRPLVLLHCRWKDQDGRKTQTRAAFETASVLLWFGPSYAGKRHCVSREEGKVNRHNFSQGASKRTATINFHVFTRNSRRMGSE